MKNRGFTLIELLVVISIIGLLSSVVLASLSTARSKATIAAGQQFDANIYHTISDQLVANWNFDNSTNPTVDNSGQNNNGTVAGGTTYNSTGGYNGKGFYDFNGSSGIITVPPSSSLNITGNLTISAWVYPKVSCSGYCGIVVARNINSVMEYGLDVDSNGIRFNYYKSDNSWYDKAFGSVPLNVWTQIAIVRDIGSNTITYYKNGTLVYKDTTGALPANAVTNQMVIGADLGFNSSSYFNGSIDDVRIYASSLLSTDIQKIYADSKDTYVAFKE